MPNPLLRDADVDFVLHDLLDVTSLAGNAWFADHDRETFALFLGQARRLARDVLFPTYRAIDEAPPRLEGGRVRVHPRLRAVYPELAALGMVAAARPAAVGGQQLPLAISTAASLYLMAGNLSAYGYVGLSAGAAHLVEAFGTDALRAKYLPGLHDGSITGTMALTEPQAGSSLADVATTATPTPEGDFLLRGSKIFISGGDHDLTDDIVHLVLARIAGAPPGTKGISLFAVPRRRAAAEGPVDNDVVVAGVIHKIGWRGLPSLALSFGDRGACRGELVGPPHRGLACMFQMMNEARLMVGANGVATASVAYLEALAYAEGRPQGRPVGAKDPTTPPVPIVAHADVRRMLLRQKAIVEAGLALVLQTAVWADLAAHADDGAERARAALLLDLMTPVAKSFPAERGFEANALALQVHGGYGYSSEYLPEAWLRDQKLNSLHEGTTGIQGLDLLGRKVVAQGGAALAAFSAEVERAVVAAREDALEAGLAEAVAAALADVVALTGELGARGLGGDVEGMLLHSADYLEVFGALVTSWLHLRAATVAAARLRAGDPRGPLLRGKLLAASYWIRTELPLLHARVAVVRGGEDAYGRVRPEEL